MAVDEGGRPQCSRACASPLYDMFFFDVTLERRYGRGFKDLNKVDGVWQCKMGLGRSVGCVRPSAGGRPQYITTAGSSCSEDCTPKSGRGMYVCMATHIARVWTNRVRLPILLVIS